MKYEIYLISLKKDEKRREFLKSEFPKFYDKFKLIEAIDGREFDALSYYKNIAPTFYKAGKILSPAEVGCALSHKLVYETFLKSNNDMALIFEDDIIGDDEMIEKVESFLEILPKNSLMICGGQDSYSAFAKNIKDELFLVNDLSKGCFTRACCYALDKIAAKKILDLQNDYLYVADDWTRLLADIKLYFCDIFSHPKDLSSSNIQSERDFAKIKISLAKRYEILKYILKTRIISLFSDYKKITKGK